MTVMLRRNFTQAIISNATCWVVISEPLAQITYKSDTSKVNCTAKVVGNVKIVEIVETIVDICG